MTTSTDSFTHVSCTAMAPPDRGIRDLRAGCHGFRVQGSGSGLTNWLLGGAPMKDEVSGAGFG